LRKFLARLLWTILAADNVLTVTPMYTAVHSSTVGALRRSVFTAEVINVMPIHMTNANKCAEVKRVGSRFSVTMLRMVEKCTVRHVAVVNVKIVRGCARRRTSAIHVLVVL
jgi:hypothetical protein